jgi:hypothetical protein
VNQRNKLDYNHCVSARNEFADNSCTAYPELQRAHRARLLRLSRSSGFHPPGSRRFTPRGYAGFDL